MSGRHRILIAEDEIIVAIFMEDLLTELGFEVAGVVSRLEEGMARARAAVSSGVSASRTTGWP